MGEWRGAVRVRVQAAAGGLSRERGEELGGRNEHLATQHDDGAPAVQDDRHGVAGSKHTVKSTDQRATGCGGSTQCHRAALSSVGGCLACLFGPQLT